MRNPNARPIRPRDLPAAISAARAKNANPVDRAWEKIMRITGLDQVSDQPRKAGVRDVLNELYDQAQERGSS